MERNGTKWAVLLKDHTHNIKTWHSSQSAMYYAAKGIYGLGMSGWSTLDVSLVLLRYFGWDFWPRIRRQQKLYHKHTQNTEKPTIFNRQTNLRSKAANLQILFVHLIVFFLFCWLVFIFYYSFFYLIILFVLFLLLLSLCCVVVYVLVL